MTEKIQMTEEQAIEIIQCVYDTKSRDFNYALERLKEKGYIRKSELETLVEEAEEMYKEWQDSIQGHGGAYTIHETRKITHKCYQALQALKKSHPEFSK